MEYVTMCMFVLSLLALPKTWEMSLTNISAFIVTSLETWSFERVDIVRVKEDVLKDIILESLSSQRV